MPDRGGRPTGRNRRDVAMSQSTTELLRSKYEAVIGLEVHAQLLTDSKIFSPDPASYGGAPNTYVDAISLAHPGTLPVFNESVLLYTLKMGLATNCKINTRSVFARKHYFYPDLPKGYQISQYEDPICYDGYVEIDLEEVVGKQAHATKRIGLTRIHMEEDAGKSIHDQDPVASLIDLNRCGVPLMEIVTEPDLRSPREAFLYLSKLRQIVRYLEICDGNMEEGSLRCDANVSVRERGTESLGVKTELKNMNSIRNVERALDYELARQIRLLEEGGRVTQQTLLWDTDKQVTRIMRSKESAHDYHYFPDPDLVRLEVSEETIRAIRGSLPEMPDERAARFVHDLGLPPYDATVLTEEKSVADYFESVLSALCDQVDTEAGGVAKLVSNIVMTDVLRVMKERNIDAGPAFPVVPQRLAALLRMRQEGKVGSSAATEIFTKMLDDPATPEAIAETHNLLQVGDADALRPVVVEIVERHPAQAEQYLGGKQNLIGFFIGQVMRTFEGTPDPKLVRALLVSVLESKRSRDEDVKK